GGVGRGRGGRRRGGGHLSGGLAGDDRYRGRHVDDRFLVLGGQYVRIRDDVDLVLARERVEHRDELIRRERERREALADGPDEPGRAPDAGRQRHQPAVGCRRRRQRGRPRVGVDEAEAARPHGPVDAEPRVVGQGDLGHQYLDQHLARHAVELLDRVLDLRPAPREGRHDHRVGDFVGDETYLPLGQDVGGVRAGGGPRARRTEERRRCRRRSGSSGRRGRRARRGGGRGAGVARAVDRVQGRREVLRLRVLRVVDEHATPAVDIDVELRDQTLDRLDLVLLGV